MNESLYLVMLKQESTKIIGYSLGFFCYEWVITWIYPIIMQSPDIAELPQSFPCSVKRAFGVATEEVDLSYEAYISAQLYGRIWTLIMSAYALNTLNSLVVQPVEQGFLAYPLASPVSRSGILNTQIAVLLTELVLVTAVSIIGVYTAAAHYKIALARWQYFRLGLLAFCLCSAVSSYSLLLTIIFDAKEEGIRCAGALTLAFYGLDVVSSLSDSLAKLKYFTPFGLFRPQEVLQGRVLPTKGFAVLNLLTWVSSGLAGILFSRKDLSV